MRAHQFSKYLMPKFGDALAHLGRVEQRVAIGVDDLALVIGHIVVFKQLLADVEVARLHFALRRLDRPRHHARLDCFTVRKLQTVHDRFQAVAREDAQQRIFHRKVKPRRTRVALTP